MIHVFSHYKGLDISFGGSEEAQLMVCDYTL